MLIQVPNAEEPRPEPLPAGRAFQFQCLRCGSWLEARTSMCGQPGRCPTCDGSFTVPLVDRHTGRAVSDADPGRDGETPTPVHAYAAAGEKAPRIIRLADGNAVIECRRCQRRSPITMNSCPYCGVPFTMEGAGPGTAPQPSGMAQAALIIGIIAMPLAFCGGLGLVPGAIAFILGLVAWMNSRGAGERTGVIGLVLGALSCFISVLVLGYMM
jgi:hypothetical protein